MPSAAGKAARPSASSKSGALRFRAAWSPGLPKAIPIGGPTSLRVRAPGIPAVVGYRRPPSAGRVRFHTQAERIGLEIYGVGIDASTVGTLFPRWSNITRMKDLVSTLLHSLQ